jgi:hypothetical protein
MVQQLQHFAAAAWEALGPSTLLVSFIMLHAPEQLSGDWVVSWCSAQ